MKFYLCDDQDDQLKLYKKKLLTLASEYKVDLEVITMNNGEKLLFRLEDEMESVDAIYLDINMPVIDGISVAEKLIKMDYPGEIIFLTVSEEHFLSAFDVGAFNYIVKSENNDERFELVFLRVIKAIEERSKEYVLLTSGGEHRKIEISQIDYFEVQNRVVTAHYDGQAFEFSSTIGKIEHHLCDKGIIRVHRSFLVNVNSVQQFTYDDLHLHDGKVIPVGRTYRSQVNKIFKKHVAEELKIS